MIVTTAPTRSGITSGQFHGSRSGREKVRRRVIHVASLFAKAIGANQGAAIGAKIACIQCDVGRRSGVWNAYADHQAHHDLPVQTPGCPKIRDEILEDAAALGGKGFSAHFGQQRWLVSRQPALRAIFSRYGWDFRGFQTQICRWRLIVRVPKSTTSARDHDVSGMAPPSRMMRAHRSRIVANISNMAAPICKKICRPWRTILPAV